MGQTAQCLVPASLGNGRGTSSLPEGKRALPGSAFCGPRPNSARTPWQCARQARKNNGQKGNRALPPPPPSVAHCLSQPPEDLLGQLEAGPRGSSHSLSRPPNPPHPQSGGEQSLTSRTRASQVGRLDSSLIPALTGCVTQDRLFNHLKSRFRHQ